MKDIIVVILIIIIVVGVSMAGLPKYTVWQQGLKGQAELRRAEQNRQITIEEAEAENIASESKAQAKIRPS